VTAWDQEHLWRLELERHGLKKVLKKLARAGFGPGALVRGFNCGIMDRGFIEDWLAEKERQDVEEQRATLLWAKVAGFASILVVGMVLLIVAMAVLIWLQSGLVTH
jgi:hypothetical protein